MFRIHLSRGIALVAVVCTFTSCATVVAGGPDHVWVSTNPTGAAVFVDDEPAGVTPMQIELDRRGSKGAIRLQLPGFEPVSITRDKSFNYWVLGNILMGGLPGLVIDLISGNAQKFDGTPIAVGLTRQGKNGVTLPAPAAITTNVTCLAARHRIFAEARTIEDPQERARLAAAAPACK